MLAWINTHTLLLPGVLWGTSLASLGVTLVIHRRIQRKVVILQTLRTDILALRDQMDVELAKARSFFEAGVSLYNEIRGTARSTPSKTVPDETQAPPSGHILH